MHSVLYSCIASLHTLNIIIGTVHIRKAKTKTLQRIRDFSSGNVEAWHHHGTRTTASFSASELRSSETHWTTNKWWQYKNDSGIQVDGMVVGRCNCNSAGRINVLDCECCGSKWRRPQNILCTSWENNCAFFENHANGNNPGRLSWMILTPKISLSCSLVTVDIMKE